MPEPLLVRAARREPVERTPVWFMRQAGRSLPEYRALRERHSFWELARTPDLCAEVTLQPVRRHDVDAAVIFADIMSPVLPLGVDVELVDGVGPVIDPPLTDASELEVPDEIAPEVAAAIRIVRGELTDDVAVIGFCGGPFTVAGYLVEGRPSRDFATVKSFIHSEPDAWHALMDVLAGCFARYVREQEAAGADAIQVFDSWAGVLSPRDYREYVAPYSARILDAVEVPTIHFGTSTAGLLPDFAAAGGDVIGLDWRIELDRGWDEVGEDRAVQGNLDPAVLLARWEEVETATLDVLDRARGRSGHIFNLGHGVLPHTHPDTLSRVRELVHARTVEARV
jgi:uroporphyrinogen decarboxylase